MSKTFIVTVEFSGTKTYEVNAESQEEVVNILDKYGSFDHYDNPVDDSVSEYIVEIKEQ